MFLYFIKSLKDGRLLFVFRLFTARIKSIEAAESFAHIHTHTMQTTPNHPIARRGNDIQNGYNAVKSLIRFICEAWAWNTRGEDTLWYQTNIRHVKRNEKESESDKAPNIFHMSTVFLCLNIAHVRCCVNIWKPYCYNANFDKNLSPMTNISTTHKYTARYLFSNKSKGKKE